MDLNTLPCKKILLIDDDQEIRDLLCEILELEGYNVVTAVDGIDGLEKLQHETVFLILVDLMMPRMNGEEFLKIAHRDRQLMHVPKVMLSANAKKQHALFANALMPKPIHLDGLLESIARFSSDNSRPRFER